MQVVEPVFTGSCAGFNRARILFRAHQRFHPERVPETARCCLFQPPQFRERRVCHRDLRAAQGQFVATVKTPKPVRWL